MTINVRDFVNKVQRRVSRFIDLELDDVEDYLAESVKKYSEYRPYKNSTSISIVADTQDYDMPSDCIEEGEEYYGKGIQHVIQR